MLHIQECIRQYHHMILMADLHLLHILDDNHNEHQ